MWMHWARGHSDDLAAAQKRAITVLCGVQLALGRAQLQTPPSWVSKLVPGAQLALGRATWQIPPSWASIEARIKTPHTELRASPSKCQACLRRSPSVQPDIFRSQPSQRDLISRIFQVRVRATETAAIVHWGIWKRRYLLARWTCCLKASASPMLTNCGP